MPLAGGQGSSITGFIGHAAVIGKTDKTAVLHRCYRIEHRASGGSSEVGPWSFLPNIQKSGPGL